MLCLCIILCMVVCAHIHSIQSFFERNLNNLQREIPKEIVHVTDVCKDSTDDDFSDTDSSKTEGYAVLDVEYEVASTTDDDEDDNSSISSGTDEFAYKTATAAYYQFNALMGRQQDSSEELTDDFILADTEDDTDGSVDLELGQADYWKCVKCNNKQNNPLYRYCEKCYQVRNSFF